MSALITRALSSFPLLDQHVDFALQLRARIADWRAGALNTAYFRARVEETVQALASFEKTSMPAGWECLWDTDRTMYLYRNTVRVEAAKLAPCGLV